MTVAMSKKIPQRPSGWTDKQFEILLIVTYLHWKRTPAAERTVRQDPWFRASCEGKPSRVQHPLAGQKRVRIKLVQEAAELSKRFYAECGEELQRRLDAHLNAGQHASRRAPNPRWALLKDWLAKTTGPELTPEEQAYSWVHQMTEASDKRLEKIPIGDADNDLCYCDGNEEPYYFDDGMWWEWCKEVTEGYKQSMEGYEESMEGYEESMEYYSMGYDGTVEC